jgi:uncharacterized membrane protein (UPF0127 family)
VNRRRPPSCLTLRVFALTFAAALLVLPAACKSPQQTSAATSPAPNSGPSVTVHAEGGRAIPFRVELARTQAEQAQGLMYRPHMDPDAGMLFVFKDPAPLTFWMRNTLIPLDMIFIGADRRIVGIVENAEPQTDTTRRVPGISQYVLEINGGLSAKLGVRPGSTVDFRDVPAP